MFVIFIDVAALFAIRFLANDYRLISDTAFFPSIVSRPELMNVIEPRDRLLALLVVSQPIIIATSFFVSRYRRKRLPSFSRLISVVIPIGATLVLMSLVNWRDSRPLFTSWKGFNAGRVALCFGVLTGIFILATKSGRVVATLKIWSSAIGILLLVCFSPYFLQFGNSVRDPYHSRFIIDELLAAASGSAPLVDYTAQYVQILGLPLVPVVHLFDNRSVQIVVTFVSLLQINVIVLIFAIFRRIVGWQWALGATPFVIVAMLTAAPGASLSATVAAYWAVMPIRVIGPLALILIATFLHPTNVSYTTLCGVIGALVTINNPDWGLPATLAVLCAIIATSSNLRVAGRKLRRAALGAVFALIGILLLLLPWGVPQLSRIFEFSRLFGASGYFAVPALPWGIHLIVLGSHIACLLVGLAISPLVSRSGENAKLAGAMTCAGVVGLGTFLYFVNRSLTAVLASTFTFWAISVALMFVFFCRVHKSIGSSVGLIRGLPVLLLFSLVISVFQPPEPFKEVSRLSGSIPSMNFDLDQVSKDRLDLVREQLARLRVSPRHVGLIGLDTSWLAIRSGTNNLTNYNSVDSIVTFAQANRLCAAIRAKRVTHIIVTEQPAAPEVLEVLGRCTQIERTEPVLVLTPTVHAR